MMRSGEDSISGRKLDLSKPLVFYFDAGEKEKEYHPKDGSANLVKATQIFAEAAIQKGHRVIDNTVHVLANGNHHNMTWMRNLADAAKSIHFHLKLELTSNAQLFQSLDVKSKTQELVAGNLEKKTAATTGDTASQSEKNKKPTQEFSADNKQASSNDVDGNYSGTTSFRKK